MSVPEKPPAHVKSANNKTPYQLEQDIRELTRERNNGLREIVALHAKNKALLIERNFWVQQGRELQNQLQTWQTMYANMFDQLGRGVVTEESVAENLALAAEELRQPISVVEAVNAAFAMLKDDTQGQYTSIGKRKAERESLLNWDDDDDTP